MTFEGNDATGNGGAFSGPSEVTVANSAFVGNTAVGNGGAIALNGDTFSPISTSYFTQNSAGATGGAFHTETNAAINATNLTVHGNTAASGGGGIQVESSAKDSYFGFSTITGNTVTAAGTPAGVRVLGGGPSPFVEVFATILAGNTSQSGLHNCGATVQTPANDGYSLEDGNTCALPTTPTDHNLINTNPQLAPLADNGGGTLTRALYAGSPAIDAIPDAACPDATFDQREVVRPNGGCDIGAFEGSIPAPPVVTPPVTTTPPAAVTPPPATKKKCKKGRKLRKGKCVKKKRK
jgi:predicted outer membrane repeat protein